MTDMKAALRAAALDAASKPLARGPKGARQLARAGRGLAVGAFAWSWDYREVRRARETCGAAGCMIGLAQMLWPTDVPWRPSYRMDIIGEYLGMTNNAAHWIFQFAGNANGRDITMCQVTPDMVADDLDSWADEQEAA